jgi:acetyl-CoA carboxylase carboxyl transferase subunit beta
MPIFGKTKFSTVNYDKTTPTAAMPSLEDSENPQEGFTKCRSCESPILIEELQANSSICPKCDFHFPLRAKERINSLMSNFVEIDADMQSVNFLGFTGYDKTLVSKQMALDTKDAVICGFGKIKDKEAAIVVMDFKFMGGSLGSVVGEKITRLVEAATEKRLPVILVTASGGARMQEGCVSLMQMAKTSGALARLSNNDLPLICLLTNPTYGGVTASFASLGDIILSEPNALIGFAGARVIETTIKAELPEDFQTAEFLVDHGLVDRIVHREQLKDELALILDYVSGKCK